MVLDSVAVKPNLPISFKFLQDTLKHQSIFNTFSVPLFREMYVLLRICMSMSNSLASPLGCSAAPQCLSWTLILRHWLISASVIISWHLKSTHPPSITEWTYILNGKMRWAYNKNKFEEFFSAWSCWLTLTDYTTFVALIQQLLELASIQHLNQSMFSFLWIA